MPLVKDGSIDCARVDANHDFELPAVRVARRYFHSGGAGPVSQRFRNSRLHYLARLGLFSSGASLIGCANDVLPGLQSK